MSYCLCCGCHRFRRNRGKKTSLHLPTTYVTILWRPWKTAGYTEGSWTFDTSALEFYNELQLTNYTIELVEVEQSSEEESEEESGEDTTEDGTEEENSEEDETEDGTEDEIQYEVPLRFFPHSFRLEEADDGIWDSNFDGL